MTPEERAESLITWTMPDMARSRLVGQISAAIREAEAEEREACLVIVENVRPVDQSDSRYWGAEETCSRIARMIRERAN
jgi:hypothetical protein